MTTPTPSPHAARIGPERFQRSVAEDSDGRRLAPLGAALLLVLLVVGVPALLISLGGVPGLPTGLPTRAQLTGTIGVPQLMSALLWVVWLAWLQFTISVLVELRSALSGVGLPPRVPLAGASQRLARTLVASALLLVTVAGQATALEPGQGAQAGAPVAVVQTVASTDEGREPSAVADEAAAQETRTTYWLGDLQLDPEEGEALAGRKVYVVQPPEGRYHDNLWDIAERTVGDGRRYQEIFDLNRGRAQPDGQELSLARLIYPGWLIAVPEDATGVERVEVRQVAQAPQAEPEEAAPSLSEAGAVAVPVGLDRTADRTAAADVQVTPAAARHEGLVGAGLLAAGLLATLEGARRRRRRRAPEPAEAELEVALRIGADPSRARRLDAALRGLAAAHQAERRPLPPVYAARVDDEQVELWCSPPAPAPPSPWTEADGGRRWVLSSELDHVVAGARAGVAFPGLVSLGRDDTGADVLIDLEAAQGPVAVVGAGAHDVVTALAAELATNLWSAELEVHAVDLPPALEQLGDRLHRAEVAAVVAAWRRVPEDRDVLTGRVSYGGGSLTGRYLMLGALPGAAEAEALGALGHSGGRTPWGVVCAGDLPGARWQLEVEGERLRVPALGLSVRANRLRADDAAGIAGLLDEAPALVAERPGDPARPAVPLPPRTVTLDAFFAAPVAVRVMGAPEITGAGPIDVERLALATEVVVHVAMHPEGVHPAVLGADLWPRGVTPDVVDSTLARVAVWLGSGADGRPRLRPDADGRWTLSPEVVTDWHVVLGLLERSRRTADPRQEREDLADALDLSPAAVLSQRPPGRYSWLARARDERASEELLEDAAHRLGAVCLADGDPVGAARAARDGLRSAPLSGLLWRDLLRASAAEGGTDAVLPVAAELERTLHRAGVVEVDAQTAALLDHLVPGTVRERRREA
ncbi:hypothetical protein OEB99_09555 [Actinotalea sp. M2MS4P-6]|uniref:LysM peptidoglycan-binding domain-containing protein n=1 Tax=Actinotalea sp. M2MS4P-6 TaxID=2983762 RepID=UPI0021E49C75|nr:hypothetical protein [Actinotalea sp. M2MS4P-6]MCV2394551.1 hypothetical protein [Actinotalea sp. M2MS4P-6]